MVVNLEGLGSSFIRFRNETASLSGVSNVAQASISLFKDRGMAGFFTKTPKTNEDVFINVMTVDPDFFTTLSLQWHRKLNDSVTSGDLIINESALSKLRLTENNLGEKLMLGGETSSIIGIVKDFNYASLKEKINGVIMYVADPSAVAESFGNKGALYIRLNTGENVFEMTEQVKRFYNKHQPTAPFEYYFLDDAFNNLYQAEDRLAMFFKFFTILAICIACLGLFGLVTFTTERRKKEIGIRTILGASVPSVLTLISREFVWMVIPGVLVATPLAWVSMDMWLSDFPYRISLSPAMFLTGGAIVIALALITIWLQAAKAASANPVTSLRTE
jgi:putative ABC transport system permease protein